MIQQIRVCDYYVTWHVHYVHIILKIRYQTGSISNMYFNAKNIHMRHSSTSTLPNFNSILTLSIILFSLIPPNLSSVKIQMKSSSTPKSQHRFSNLRPILFVLHLWSQVTSVGSLIFIPFQRSAGLPSWIIANQSLV